MLYAFHETISDLKKKLMPMIIYVQSLPEHLDPRHNKQLKHLWLACRDTEKTIVSCYHTKIELKKILIERERKKKTDKQMSLAETLFGKDDKDKLNSSGTSEEQDEKETRFRNKIIE